MGGTFDPIHFGHLVAAEAARCEFGLDKVIFVPSGRPPHKPHGPVTDKESRYLMTVLATINNPFFEVSRVELDREGYSFTVDTLKEFRSQFTGNVELFFITGADAVLQIFTWKAAEQLLDLCTVIAATRPGYPLEELKATVEAINRTTKGHVEVLQVPALAISSSDIRHRVKEGRSIKYLLPDAVEHYIMKRGLYRNTLVAGVHNI